MPALSRRTMSAQELTKRSLTTIAIVAVVVLWSYASVLLYLVGRWWGEDDYVYGFLVLPFCAFVLWQRREWMPYPPLFGNYWGLFVLAFCALIRVYAAMEQRPQIDALSIVPCVAGLVFLIAGIPGILWSWPAIVFLVFMVPLPERAAQVLGLPLQKLGATTSTYLLQTLGIPATLDGTIIHLPSGGPMGVEEACSGLRMLMLFVAVCVGAAIVMTDRPPWERWLVVVSAFPIAIVANVLRITITGFLCETAGKELAQQVFHGLAGLIMMPLAVVLLWIELWIISFFYYPSEEEDVWF